MAFRTYSGRPLDAAATPVLAAHVAELGRQLHLVAAPGDRPAHELLVGERPVHVGGVQQGHAEVEGAVDRLGRACLVPAAVELAHAHAAQPERGDGEPALVGAERAGGDGRGGGRRGHVLLPTPRRLVIPPHRDLTGSPQRPGSGGPDDGSHDDDQHTFRRVRPKYQAASDQAQHGAASDQRRAAGLDPRGPAARGGRRAQHPRAARDQPALRRLRGGHGDQRARRPGRGPSLPARPRRPRRDDARHGRLRGRPADARRGVDGSRPLPDRP